MERIVDYSLQMKAHENALREAAYMANQVSYQQNLGVFQVNKPEDQFGQVSQSHHKEIGHHNVFLHPTTVLNTPLMTNIVFNTNEKVFREATYVEMANQQSYQQNLLVYVPEDQGCQISQKRYEETRDNAFLQPTVALNTALMANIVNHNEKAFRESTYVRMGNQQSHHQDYLVYMPEDQDSQISQKRFEETGDYNAFLQPTIALNTALMANIVNHNEMAFRNSTCVGMRNQQLHQQDYQVYMPEDQGSQISQKCYEETGDYNAFLQPTIALSTALMANIVNHNEIAFRDSTYVGIRNQQSHQQDYLVYVPEDQGSQISQETGDYSAFLQPALNTALLENIVNSNEKAFRASTYMGMGNQQSHQQDYLVYVPEDQGSQIGQNHYKETGDHNGYLQSTVILNKALMPQNMKTNGKAFRESTNAGMANQLSYQQGNQVYVPADQGSQISQNHYEEIEDNNLISEPTSILKKALTVKVWKRNKKSLKDTVYAEMANPVSNQQKAKVYQANKGIEDCDLISKPTKKKKKTLMKKNTIVKVKCIIPKQNSIRNKVPELERMKNAENPTLDTQCETQECLQPSTSGSSNCLINVSHDMQHCATEQNSKDNFGDKQNQNIAVPVMTETQNSNISSVKFYDETVKVCSSKMNKPEKSDSQQIKTAALSKEEINVPNTNKNVNETKNSGISELDKFKRRLIRTVARLLLEEKKPDEEVWKELKNETSCDCKLLWTRMSALTIKKLKRLFVANDRINQITKIAQLTVTDWLLFDLVLVHEDVDVIGQDIQNESKVDPEILEDLFRLVVKYRIEHLTGDVLTNAWYNLTAEYNKNLRKCSPMLLQRRWYQMKEQVRYNFYNFWFTFRGLTTNLETAEKYRPTDLQMAIVTDFVYIVTQPFKSWEDLINEKKVSLYSDFERLHLNKKRRVSNRCVSENEPDIQLIEPHIETIDLRVESDEEINYNENSRDSVNSDSNDGDHTKVRVKTESVIYDLCDEGDVSALESVHIPLEQNARVKNTPVQEIAQDSDVEYVGNKEQNIETSGTQEKVDVKPKNIIDLDSADDENDIVITNHENLEVEMNHKMVMPKITNTMTVAKIPVEDDMPEEINNILERVCNNLSKNNNDQVSNIKKQYDRDTVTKQLELEKNLLNDITSSDMNFIGSIELEDDGIQDVDEDTLDENVIQFEENCTQENDDEDTTKIDLKLLLYPVVYTKKLDDMDAFRFTDGSSIKDRAIIETIDMESKPCDIKSLNMKDISEEQLNGNGDYCSESESQCSMEDEQKRFNATSWLFQKPKAPTYNPIQLCKNPDFNTRLKRLTAGFFSSERNRLLLKECKPLTIDLHKTFESRLVNNTLYLKQSTCQLLSSEPMKVVDKTVLPSELPGQALTCTKPSVNTQSIPPSPKIPVVKEEPILIDDVTEPERNKVINLPNIDQIRRTNEKLLIAEVTPIQLSNTINKPPVTLVDRNTRKLEISQNEINEDANTSNNSHVLLNIPVIEDEIHGISNTDEVQSVKKYKRKKIQKDKTHTKYSYKNRPINLTWIPRNEKAEEIPSDRLLACDTVQRIISVCKGINGPIYSKKRKKAKGTVVTKDTAGTEKVESNKTEESINEQIKCDGQFLIERTGKKRGRKRKNKTSENNVINDEIANNEKIYATKSKSSKKVKRCCWARNKLDYWDNKVKQVHMIHRCPQEKCVCCCNLEYLERMRSHKLIYIQHKPNVETQTDQFSTVPVPKVFVNEQSSNILTKGNKVSTGINTDFDKDFEVNFAANVALNDREVRRSIETPCPSYLSDTKEVDKSTQTVRFKVLSLNRTTSVDIMSLEDRNVPVISDVKSISTVLTQNLIDDQNKDTILPKCKINIQQGFSNMPEGQKDSTTDTMSVNSMTILDSHVQKRITKNPIRLGKNKILLYSLKPLSKADMVDVTNMVENCQSSTSELSTLKQNSPIIIPDGVNLALLPNQELVVAIDPGVELDQVQINNLPNIIAAVQQQLIAMGTITKKSVTKINIPVISDVIQLSEDENTNESQDNITEPMETNLTTNKSEKDISPTKMVNLDESETTQSACDPQVQSVTKTADIPTDEANDASALSLDNENTVANVETEPGANTDRGIEINQYVNIDVVASNGEIPDSQNSTEYLSNGDSTKKTILSDLMEMSGISLEDTSTPTVGTSAMQSEPLQPLVVCMPKHPTKAIYWLQNNPFVQAALLKCPDLDIVTSFEELKNINESGGYFYKMDINTGIIAPINICIKKKVSEKNKLSTITHKHVIDLTEDDENKNHQMSPTTTSIDTSPLKLIKILPKPAQPVKLFKSIHASSLKKAESILNRIDGNHINTECIETDRRRSRSESDDDEPLALKAKRKKDSSQLLNFNFGCNSHTLKKDCSSKLKLSFETNERVSVNSQEILNSNQVVAPALLNTDDSDEDCILGV